MQVFASESCAILKINGFKQAPNNVDINTAVVNLS